MRKFWFAYLAKALVIFPGGFGTMDELFEILTLAQTRKLESKIVIVLYGTKFWKEVLNFEALVEHGTIDREDLNLFQYADDPETALGHFAGAVDPLFPGAGEAAAGRGVGNSRDRQIARVNFSIQSLWKRTGKVEKAFAVSLALYLILLVAWPAQRRPEPFGNVRDCTSWALGSRFACCGSGCGKSPGVCGTG